MSCRPAARIVFVVSLLFTAVASAETAPPTVASPSSAPAQKVSAPEAAPAKSLAGFEILVSAGYGSRTSSVFGLELEPYGASFGLEPGYTFKRGFRLGAYLDYGMGRRLDQEYQPRRGSPFEMSTDGWSLNTGLSFGGDLWLHFLILRYTLNFGLTWLNWDYRTPPNTSLLGYPTTQGSTFGAHIAPGLAVLWPLGLFEFGLGFDYFVQFKDQIPSGFQGKLLLGVKL